MIKWKEWCILHLGYVVFKYYFCYIYLGYNGYNILYGNLFIDN